MREPLGRWPERSSNFMLAAGAVGLILMTAIIGYQVFGRYVLHSSPSWAEEASLILMIWYVFFAAAAGVRERFHIRITALENAVPAHVRRPMRWFVHTVVALAGLSLAIWGTELVCLTWEHEIPTLGLSRGVAYLPLPLSGVLMILFSIEHLLRGDPAGDEDEASVD
ncbi:TRAP transporter small permease [Stakelama saccharophila]|uniref:TRAP transporter small permease protein n=1 Tax=Stakelama saccharophila TaxID=3075605 RepID=A0ABZ0BC88_9SPHN|nr:TRAP transporter small permease [Stakelama sp. W311]WNO54812.1 TRAP transporter small permease [Stakelama sp. W311]